MPRVGTEFVRLLSISRPPIYFMIEIESDSAVHFIDILVIRKEMTLATKLYRKPTHIGQHLNLSSNNLLHVHVFTKDFHMPRTARSV
jgi:hypothetical protein